jgi:hypothetical protein
MSSPDGSIANLSVTRKTLGVSKDEKLHARAFEFVTRRFRAALVTPAPETRR